MDSRMTDDPNMDVRNLVMVSVRQQNPAFQVFEPRLEFYPLTGVLTARAV